MCSLIRVFSLSLFPFLVLPLLVLLACGGTPTTSSSEETPAAAPAGTLISAAGLSFYMPEGWTQPLAVLLTVVLCVVYLSLRLPAGGLQGIK